MARLITIALILLLLVTTPCLAMTEAEYKALLEEAREIIEGYQALLEEKDQTINALLEINEAKDAIIKNLQKQKRPKLGLAVGTELSVRDAPKLILMITYSF